MKNKLGLIFIKICPILLFLDTLSKLFIIYVFNNYSINIYYTIDTITKILLVSGIGILSYNLKYCIYYRLLIYLSIISYIIVTLINLTIIDYKYIFVVLFIILILLFFFAYAIIVYLIRKRKSKS